MNYDDIQSLHADGMITTEQRDVIVARYKLQEGQNKMMAILSILGGILVSSGITLVIASNWDQIPRFAKLATGLVLMLGAHRAGWWLRTKHPDYGKSAETLHLMGSGMFLANIALIGQVYHLSSHPPNAILLWWIGIAPLAWILRSKAHYVTALAAFLFWLGMEFEEGDGYLRALGYDAIVICYPILMLMLYGVGMWMERTKSRAFASATQKFALLLYYLFALPMIWGWQDNVFSNEAILVAFAVLSMLATAALAIGLRGETRLTLQWRWTWFGTLVAWIVMVMVGGLWNVNYHMTYNDWHHNPVAWTASIILFVQCLLQTQVGLFLGSRFHINVALTFLAIVAITCYIRLLGTMAATGFMFIVSGLGLIGLGILLEKRRRALMKQLNQNQKNNQP